MAYQIIRYEAIEHPVYGGICGSRARRLPMSYSSRALAEKIAARLWDENYRGCGDDSFRVVEYDAPAFSASVGCLDEVMPW